MDSAAGFALLSGCFCWAGQRRGPPDGTGPTDVLQAAAAAGKANGLITSRPAPAWSSHWQPSVNGDFAAAEELGAAATDRARASSWPCRERLAPVWLGRGIAGYWQDDLDRAE